MLWNLECPVGLSQREMYASFNEGIFVSFGRSAQNICGATWVFLIISLKVAQIGPGTC